MDIAIREAVLRIFECHRTTPGAPFNESNFLDYLLATPKKTRAVHDSFFGLRRYNAFVDEVQIHFSICFSQQDFEAGYTLSKFVDRVAELRSSRRSSIASFRNQRRHGFGWGTIVASNVFAVALIAGTDQLSPFLATILAVMLVAANTYQSPDSIAAGIRMVSTVELWNGVANHLGAQPADMINKAKGIKGQLAMIVDRRNKIAHEGDMQPSVPRIPWPISQSDLQTVSGFIFGVVEAIDAIV